MTALLAAGAWADYRTAHRPGDGRDYRWDVPPTATALMHAAYSGNVEVIQLILDHLHQVNVAEYIHIRDNLGSTALHWWARGEQGGTCSLHILLKAGADLNTRDDKGLTALYWSAQCGNEAAICALVQAGADVHAKDEMGWTALYCSSFHDEASVRTLLGAGAEVNASDEEGLTALHLATDEGHATIVQLLVEAGADVRLRASSSSNKLYTDLTPLEVALLYDNTAVADFLGGLSST